MGYIIHTNEDGSDELTMDSDIEEVVGKDAEEYVKGIYENGGNPVKEIVVEFLKFAKII